MNKAFCQACISVTGFSNLYAHSDSTEVIFEVDNFWYYIFYIDLNNYTKKIIVKTENLHMKLLTDKVIVVTGATSGLGEAAAYEIARQGAKVVISGRREDRGKAVAEKIKKEGNSNVLFVPGDITKEEDIASLMATTVKHFGRLDGAFNNAGALGTIATLDQLKNEDLNSLLQLNMFSVFQCMKYEALEMKKTNGGSIVNNTSVAGRVGVNGFGAYTTSKFAVEGLTKTGAVDFGADDIRVNTVAPGPIHSEIWDPYDNGEDMMNGFGQLTIMKRFGREEEVAKPVVFLLSDWASYITGVSLLIDGGLLAKIG